MSRLGDTVRQARMKAGLSEKQLGKKTGMAESFIKDVESGRRIVSDDQAQRILRVLGVKDPAVSAEMEVAAEPEVKLRPRPRPYVLPVADEKREKAPSGGEGGSSDAWLDALGGVVKRVPVMDENGLVIDHILEPVTGGRIEGGAPEKVFYYRCEDDALRGWRIFAGDLLLAVPENSVIDGMIAVVQYKGKRIPRKINRQDGDKLLLQSCERDFEAIKVSRSDVLIIGRCVRLRRML